MFGSVFSVQSMETYCWIISKKCYFWISLARWFIIICHYYLLSIFRKDFDLSQQEHLIVLIGRWIMSHSSSNKFSIVIIMFENKSGLFFYIFYSFQFQTIYLYYTTIQSWLFITCESQFHLNQFSPETLSIYKFGIFNVNNESHIEYDTVQLFKRKKNLEFEEIRFKF